MADYRDFLEIAPCGGVIDFTIKNDAEGLRRYAITIRSEGGGPAAYVGVYALLPQGIPVMNFRLGVK